MTSGRNIISLVAQRQDLEQFRKKNWLGTFEDYLDLVRQQPAVARNAFERVYDMIMSRGTHVYEESRGEKRVHYKFFDDPDNEGRDAVFGLDGTLESFVNALKSAAKGYGIEKRVLLLHGPVGSSKSTIARLMKRGMERYSGTDEGAVYTLGWVSEADESDVHWCPMHEEPLHLIPERFREEVLSTINVEKTEEDYKVRIIGEMCPYCRFMYTERLKKYSGDWTKVIHDVRVKRIALSEQDRCGIGTFQPKDEKNQDSTELTGDINYRKIAEYGSTAIRGPSTSTANSTSPTAASLSSSKSSSWTWPSSTISSAPARSTRSSRRNSPRPTSTRSSSATPMSRNTAACRTTSSWRPSATAP